ncbi:SfnB family sulfur acquisition oxidoreductase [Frankia tisae]|uniref:SfnB family sulfur acquisition oxidoreductase n=1 Tax=Frankia tisae TaxID=2950104 RepID=UPI0021BF17D1|nr:SfnB family sulfur acquisition oxidoreductase [Frankia tisae]
MIENLEAGPGPALAEATPTAAIITSDAQAIAVAQGLADRFRPGAARRDAARLLPFTEVEELSASGLMAITVPRSHGGADVSTATLAEVVWTLAAADPNIAQVPQGHLVYLQMIRLLGDAGLQRQIFADVLAGRRVANAQAEAASAHVRDIRARLRPKGTDDPEGTGRFVLDATKHYATGTLFAHWIAVLALVDSAPAATAADGPADPPKIFAALLRRETQGLRVLDDWAGMGQRTTASGTVIAEAVEVDGAWLLPLHRLGAVPTILEPFAQLIHGAIDVGIARGALNDAVEFVRTRTRPRPEAGLGGSAADDPLLVQRLGEIALEVRTAEALLAQAGRTLDSVDPPPTAAAVARASHAVALAKVAAERASISVGSAVFELSGARGTLDEINLHRHWRNARTHTLHDPVRWKVQAIGRHELDTPAPRRLSLIDDHTGPIPGASDGLA